MLNLRDSFVTKTFIFLNNSIIFKTIQKDRAFHVFLNGQKLAEEIIEDNVKRKIKKLQITHYCHQELLDFFFVLFYLLKIFYFNILKEKLLFILRYDANWLKREIQGKIQNVKVNDFDEVDQVELFPRSKSAIL